MGPLGNLSPAFLQPCRTLLVLSFSGSPLRSGLNPHFVCSGPWFNSDTPQTHYSPAVVPKTCLFSRLQLFCMSCSLFTWWTRTSRLRSKWSVSFEKPSLISTSQWVKWYCFGSHRVPCCTLGGVLFILLTPGPSTGLAQGSCSAVMLNDYANEWVHGTSYPTLAHMGKTLSCWK